MTNFFKIHEKILNVEFYEDTKVEITTDKGVYVAEIDDSEQCCEIFGGYFVYEDVISHFIGAELKYIYLTDISLSNHIVEKIEEMQNYYESCDYHNIQFINFETTKGVMQFIVYNCHNGYYGHDVVIKKDSQILYSDKI